MAHLASLVRPAAVRGLALLAGLALFAGAAHAQPTLGFVEDFPGISTSSWAGGAITANPGSGGIGGASDGYLDVQTLSESNLGTVSFGAEYQGNWAAAGITRVRCWMRDFGGSGDLLIHLSLSNGLATFQQNAGFNPPVGSWAEYVVDLNPGDFTRTRGLSGTFASVLQTVDRLHFRHDLAPYGPTPDPKIGHFGLDHIVLTNSSTDVAPGFGTRPVLLEPPYPNPARGRVTFQLRQPEPKPVRLTIYDAAGRRVREVELGAGGSAPQLWLWDGNDDAGRAVPAGVYRALARGVNGGMSRTVTLLR